MRDIIGEMILKEIGTHFSKSETLTKEEYQAIRIKAKKDFHEAWDF